MHAAAAANLLSKDNAAAHRPHAPPPGFAASPGHCNPCGLSQAPGVDPEGWSQRVDSHSIQMDASGTHLNDQESPTHAAAAIAAAAARPEDRHSVLDGSQHHANGSQGPFDDVTSSCGTVEVAHGDEQSHGDKQSHREEQSLSHISESEAQAVELSGHLSGSCDSNGSQEGGVQSRSSRLEYTATADGTEQQQQQQLGDVHHQSTEAQQPVLGIDSGQPGAEDIGSCTADRSVSNDMVTAMVDMQPDEELTVQQESSSGVSNMLDGEPSGVLQDADFNPLHLSLATRADVGVLRPLLQSAVNAPTEQMPSDICSELNAQQPAASSAAELASAPASSSARGSEVSLSLVAEPKLRHVSTVLIK